MAMTDAVDKLLRGGVDLHCHSGPSPFPRRVDHLGVARHYAELGFRAVVAKSHHHCTAFDIAALGPYGLAELPLDVFGGIALNNPVGGINPIAVDVALRMGTRVVWMPTIGADRHLAFHHEHPDAFPHPAVALLPEPPIPVLGADGELLPEVRQVVELIADAGAVLASGHLGPAEIVMTFEAAVAAGATRLLLNHPNFIVEASYADAERIVGLGAYVEHNLSLYDPDSIFCRWPVEELARWIEEVGPEHTILASDLGQARNPLPAESYRRICGQLLDLGIGEDALRQIVAENPARLLGLDD
jgi:hypothetical protein